MYRSAILLALTLLIPGCGALSALQGEPNRNVFELRGPPVSNGQCRGAKVSELVVELPKARGTLDSPRIMIRPSALQTEYLPDAVWGDPVPATLQRLLVESLGSYDAIGHVGREPLGLAGEYAMISEITDFNADPAPAHLMGDSGCGAGAEERVEDEIAGISGNFKDALQETFWLGSVKDVIFV